MMVGIDCLRCLRIDGDESPGQVMNHPASIALQKVCNEGHPTAAQRKVASFFALDCVQALLAV